MSDVARDPDGGASRTLPAVGAALALTVVYVVALSIPLATAASLGLNSALITGWILALYGVSGVLTVVLVARYRQPLLVTPNIFVLIFIASLGSDLTWAELVGAAVVAGALVLLVGASGLTGRLAAWVPAPVVFGLLAGAVMPFVVDMFSGLGDAGLIIGGTLVAYVAGRVVLEPRLPAILAALVGGIAIAAVAGRFGPLPATLPLPVPEVTAPAFTLRAIVTATPVMAVLITLQANVPSLVFLRSQQYTPPERTISILSGGGTLLGSFLGPMGVSLSLPATALTAGPDAGPHDLRHRAAYMAGGAAIVIALLAGVAAELEQVVPSSLLSVLVGLAVLGVLVDALRQVARGPLVLGPVFAFAIALSDLSLFGLGRFFWALVVGVGISLLLEHDALVALRDRREEPATAA